MSLSSEPTLLQLKIKLRKEKDIVILNMIQTKIDKKITDSRDRWWFKKKFFEELVYTSSEEELENLNEELNRPRTIDRILLDSEILNNYSTHIDKPYVITPTNKKLGSRKNIH
jgi:hypothetical protein